MAIAVHISPQKMSRDDYERVIKDLEDSGDGDPDGRAFHACGVPILEQKHLTWASILSGRAHSRPLSAHGPGVRLAGPARAQRHLQGGGDPDPAARGRGPSPPGRPAEAA